MGIEDLGRITLHTRVEQWECDFNNHWNLRFYARSFQLAAEVIATEPGAFSPGTTIVSLRHMRFHRELFVNAPVEVRSAVVGDGPHQGQVVHILSSAGRLAATALDRPARAAASLPTASASDLVLALPRQVFDQPAGELADDASAPMPMGPIRPAECDHTGALLWEELIRRVGFTSHEHITKLGFTPAFVQESGINRMSVEMRLERHSEIPVGRCLQAHSRLLAVGRKSFSTEHRIESDTGTVLALIRQNLVAVDLTTRRAVEVPDFLRRALE